MAEMLDQLVRKLGEAFPQDLVSVVLYGSAAVGDHNEQFSDYNVLCVLLSITPAQLGATEAIFRWWRGQGNPSPLLLTLHEVETSTDCFAIEFEDVKEHHRILYGADVVSSLTIDRCFYRAQVEHDLRAKLLRLRQKAAAVLSDKDALCQLLADSVSTFCVLFRHALILHGLGAAGKKREIVAQARERFGIEAAPFISLLDLRDRSAKGRDIEPVALLTSYLAEISKVIDAVDVLEKPLVSNNEDRQ
jgi:hypothetical protein